MPRISRQLNIISRCQSSYRRMRLEGDFAPGYHAYALAICARPGRSQDELADALCINKSTIARGIDWLLENGYVRRELKPEDKRCFLVYPTDKMLEIYPKVKMIADSWNKILTEDISEEELAVTYSVIAKMAEHAKRAALEIGGDKQ
ncbi:MAG: MarR family transcriptional regulator [Ruminococcaceae bacterium]|nr:MarR family transcriptional regulator [Oscillospiraceae bacterium]